MSEILTMITDVLNPLLDEACSPQHLRAFESGEPIAPLWEQIKALGFADAAIAEASGGAGLDLSDLGELSYLFGRHLLPLPLADTMVARAILTEAGQAVPEGLIVLATNKQPAKIETAPIMLATVADHALVECPEGVVLIDININNIVSSGVSRSLSAALTVHEEQAVLLERQPISLRVISATLRAAEMAGMLSRMLELAVTYTSERTQFGKKIGRFQAIQQQLAVLAEESAATKMAAKLAFMGPEFNVVRSSAAKMRAGSAATKAAAIAHAVHGAMGFSEEYDLQLYSRRLIESRLAEGSESFWAAELGMNRLQSESVTNLDFVRSNFC